MAKKLSICKIEKSGLVVPVNVVDDEGKIDKVKVVNMVKNEMLMKTPELTDVLIEIVKDLPLEDLSPKAQDDDSDSEQRKLLDDLKLELEEGQ